MAALAAVALHAGCGDGSGNAGARRHTVEMRGLAFMPATLQAAAGDTVVFVNRDVMPHTASAGDAFETGALAAGDSAVLVLRGAVQYVCAFHPTMQGTIDVR